MRIPRWLVVGVMLLLAPVFAYAEKTAASDSSAAQEAPALLAANGCADHSATPMCGSLEEAQKQLVIETAYREGRLTETEAKEQLYMLIKPQFYQLLPTVDQAIQAAETQLEEFKELKRDPDQAIRHRVERLLQDASPP